MSDLIPGTSGSSLVHNDYGLQTVRFLLSVSKLFCSILNKISHIKYIHVTIYMFSIYKHFMGSNQGSKLSVFLYLRRDIHDRMVRLIDFESLDSFHCGFESCQNSYM